MRLWMLANRALEYQLRDTNLENVVRNQILWEFSYGDQDFNCRGSATTCESEPELFFAAIFANRQPDYKDA